VFRIDIIDATTDKAIGSSIVTTQAILQLQRDFLIEEKQMPFLYFLRQGPLKFDKVRRTVLELRTGLNENDFFNPSKLQQISASPTPQDSKSRPGKDNSGSYSVVEIFIVLKYCILLSSR
jgi:hypothetical protein